ncbi:thioredoxin fold domain-containing protein [Bdellovibrio sp. HCB2-146]|uniref:thioredoxin fold domain-containing protein n=1 Tax=Bdellovibrio sp. HCB2-146 TaxID=3394362 RepID=UPI0039BCD6F3
MKFTLAFAITLLASFAQARLSDGKVHFKLEKTKVVGTVDKGFHFNKEAPASALVNGKEIEPSIKEEKSLSFEVGNANFVNLNLYVCDDKKTVCEEHSYGYAIQNGKLETSGGKAKADPGIALKNSKPAEEKKASPKMGLLSAEVKMNSHGFIENEFAIAMMQAEQKNQLVLVDYGAPWCPACVRLETEVFGTKEFQKLTKNVVKLYLNADKVANKEFGAKYKIKALPTLIVLNAKGEEIYRHLDFATTDVLVKELGPQFKKATVDWAKLEESATKGDKKAQKQLAARAMNMLDYENAVKWFEMLGEKSSDYAYSETSLWSEKYSKDSVANLQGYVQVLNKWITALPESYVSLVSRNDLAGTYDDKQIPDTVKAELQKNVELAQALLVTEKKSKKMWKEFGMSVAPYEREEILSNMITSLKKLDKKDDVEKAKAELRGLLEKKDLSINRPGEVLAGLSYFRQVDMKDKEEQWLLDLDKANPGTYSYPMKLARFYMREKKFDQALPYAQLAVERGDGLRLSNLKVLAEVQKELKQKDAAKKSIEQALALPEAKLERYQTTTKALEDLKKSL